MPVPVKSATDRMMARAALSILVLGGIYGLYSISAPLYWRFYANVIMPFESDGVDVEDDPFAAAVLHNLKHSDPLGPRKAAEQLAYKSQPDYNKETYNIENYPLSKERVHALAKDGYIMITWANHHYLDFAKSWVFHVKKVGVTSYMVGAMDDDMLEELAKEDVTTWRMDTGIHKGDLGWGSPNFHKMGRFKIALIKQFLELDVTMIISDIDTTWLRDPIPYFQRYPEADVLTSTDELRETVPDESLEDNRKSGASFNIGIMMFRNTSMELVDEWIKSLDDPKMWDQTAFNQIARRGQTFSTPETKNLWKGFDGKLNIGILPASIFCSGHMFFVQTKYKELGLEPYVAHATFQYSGTPGKRNRFREFMLWDDPPEYYDSPHGFISMSIDIPQNLWDAVKKEVKGAMTPDKIIDHYNLVHHQMGLLRTALALTTLTGRVIIMPPIWCQLDKYWAPLHNGNIPGSMFIKPFICPMDHVLDIEAGWHRKFDENHFGPHIEWREYSFLQNERMTPAVNNSRVELEVCPAGEADCEGSIVKDNKLRVPDNMDAQKLKEMLTSKVPPSTKILHLPSKTLDKFRLIHNTMPEKEKAQFIVRLNHQVSVDCCLQKNPGWVWYDFFYDIDPHTDRFGRQYTGVNKVFYAGDSKETVEVVKPARRMSAARKLTAASLEDASASFEGAEFVSVEGRRLQGEEWSYEAREGEVTLGGLSYPDAMLSAP